MFTSARSLILALLAMCLAGCGDARSRASEVVRHHGAVALRTQADFYYKDLYAAHRQSPTTIGPEHWSDAFIEFDPIRITVYRDGIGLTLEEAGGEESGLYIVPLHMEHLPTPSAWASFEPLFEGIYWYSFKP